MSNSRSGWWALTIERETEDFMTGFVFDKATVWGRPTGLAVAPDGAPLVSDDANGTMFRVAPSNR
jgi:glucose/arabinose dehydrogenase